MSAHPQVLSNTRNRSLANDRLTHLSKARPLAHPSLKIAYLKELKALVITACLLLAIIGGIMAPQIAYQLTYLSIR